MNRVREIVLVATGLVASVGLVFANEFPSTPLLDDFNRPNQSAPGGPGWISSVTPDFPGSDGLWVINQKAVTGDITESAASSWSEMFMQDQEAYYEYGDAPGTNAGMGPAVRLQDPTDRQSDQYLVFFYQLPNPNLSQVRIWKRFSGSWTNLASTFINTDLDRGDQIGLRAVGDTITAYFNGEAVLEVVDSDPILLPGYLQLYVGDDVGHTADNFGGGSLQTATGPPGLTAPTGGQLTRTSEKFTWSPNAEVVDQWWLYVGCTQGSTEYFNENMGDSLSSIVSGLPTDGESVWARLWWLQNGTWLSEDYQFAGAPENQSGPRLIQPAIDSTLAGSTQGFSWEANGAPVSRWWLQLGSTQGGVDLANLDLGTNTSTTVTGLPTDGSPVWARLWWVEGGDWRSRDYAFASAGPANDGLPFLVAPSPGSQIAGSSATFEWSANRTEVMRWWLQVGTSQGAKDIMNQNMGDALSSSVGGLPADGSSIWVRLWYLVGCEWLFEDYEVTSNP